MSHFVGGSQNRQWFSQYVKRNLNATLNISKCVTKRNAVPWTFGENGQTAGYSLWTSQPALMMLTCSLTMMYFHLATILRQSNSQPGRMVLTCSLTMMYFHLATILRQSNSQPGLMVLTCSLTMMYFHLATILRQNN